MQRFPFPRALACALLGALAGCASVPRERGWSDIRTLVDRRNGGEHVWAADPVVAADTAAAVSAIVSQPLSADGAVQIALLRNPRMQSEYARLGIAQADVFEASRIGNPTLSFTALHHSGEPAKYEAGLSVGFAELLMLPARKRLAAGEFERTQASIGAAVLDLVADTRAAWYAYVGARQVAVMRAAVADAAQASAQLAAKFLEAGNISALQCKLEEAAATQARLQALRANADATRARSALNGLMGLSGEAAAWSAADRLPAPLAVDDAVDALLPLARRQRLDLDAAQREVALLEQGVDVTRRYRLLGKVDLGIAGERETDRSKLYGPSLSLQLPIFNQGQGAVARASAQLDAARARARALDLDIENAVRLGVERVAATRSVAAEYRAALIPQREAIVARTQEQQNYMLVGAFELLLAKQQEFDAYQGYLEAVRDYWLARVDLQRSVGARLPGDDTATESTVGPDDILQAPAQPDMAHMHHGAAEATRSGTQAGDDARHAGPSSPQQKDGAKRPPRHEGHDTHDMKDMKDMPRPTAPAAAPTQHDPPADTQPEGNPSHDRSGDTP